MSRLRARLGRLERALGPDKAPRPTLLLCDTEHRPAWIQLDFGRLRNDPEAPALAASAGPECKVVTGVDWDVVWASMPALRRRRPQPALHIFDRH